jgi:hypothetical protein
MFVKFINGPMDGVELEVPENRPSQIVFPAVLGNYHFYELNTETNTYIYSGEKELEEQK